MVRRHLSRAALAAAALASIPTFSHAQTNGTWTADASLSWNNASAWLGSIPGSGGTATFNMMNNLSFARTVTQDVANVSLSRLFINSAIPWTIQSSPGTNTFTLTGAGEINITSAQNTYTNLSTGHLIDVPIAGSVGLNKTGTGIVTLNQTNTFSGSIQINGGTIRMTAPGDAIFGNVNNGITMNGGGIRVASGSGWTSPSTRTINLTGSGFVDTLSGSGTINGAINGSGAFSKLSANTLTLTAACGYSGATTIAGGTLSMNGNGAIASSSSILANGTLVLDSSSTNNSNRISNSAPITFGGGGITITGNGGASPTNEVVGAITLNGGVTFFSISPGGGANTSLAAPSITRQNRGVAFFRGANFGDAAGAGVANTTFTVAPLTIGGGGAPGSTNISVIPWAWGGRVNTVTPNGGQNGLCTYGPNGVRVLDFATEYVLSVASLTTATDNLRLSAAEVLASPLSINGLVMEQFGSISGAGTLTIGSGAIVNLGSGNTISCPINFGNTEGVIMNPATSGTFSGIISGTQGVTFSGSGTNQYRFGNNNNYSGVTTILQSRMVISASVPNNANSPFGNSTSDIVIAPGAGATASLWSELASTLTISRNIVAAGASSGTASLGTSRVNDSMALVVNGGITLDGQRLLLECDANPAMVLNGNITGTGSLSDSFSSNQVLNGNNTFSGGIEVQTGGYVAGSDTAFGTGTIYIAGNGGSLSATGSARTLANNMVVSNNFTVAGSVGFKLTGNVDLNGGTFTQTINNSADTEWAGAVSNGGLVKAGTGRLVLSGNNTYTGVTQINSGILEIRSAGALGTVQNNTVVPSGMQLALSNNALSGEPVNVTGDGPSSTGSIRSLSGNNSLGTITLGSNTTIAVDSGTLTTGQINSTFNVTKIGAGALRAARYRVNTLTVSAGTAGVAAGRSTSNTSVVNTLTIGANRVDMADNDFVIDYTGSTPFTTVQTQITSGYAGGAWTGAGINSSSAAASPTSDKTAIAFAEATALFTTFPASFSGVTVDNTSILFRYTYSGDATMNGTVDSSDFNLLASNFGGSGKQWVTGDFTFDGLTNSSDFNALAGNFGKTLASGPGASVPEPALTGLAALAAMFMARRRR